MQSLKVRKVGNSLGVVLPKETTARLGVVENDVIYLTESPDGYRITTGAGDDFERQMKIGEEFMKRYRNTLRALAK